MHSLQLLTTAYHFSINLPYNGKMLLEKLGIKLPFPALKKAAYMFKHELHDFYVPILSIHVKVSSRCHLELQSHSFPSVWPWSYQQFMQVLAVLLPSVGLPPAPPLSKTEPLAELMVSSLLLHPNIQHQPHKQMAS